MFETPLANRLHIAIFGRRNAGKSSLINALTNQDIALVSETAGTTTDPVYKAMELLPIGPVVFIDTAGLDDEGELGELRIKKTKAVMDKTDLGLLVITYGSDLKLEKEWLLELKKRNIKVLGVVNKIDENEIDIKMLEDMFKIPFIKVSAKDRKNIDVLKRAIYENAPMDFERSTIVGDIIKPKDSILLVAPQDIQAPKGRLILPQVQVLRDVLDAGAMACIVKDSELKESLENLSKIDLVITDSQVFKYVNDTIPKDMPLTSFSILMARYKGDLKTLIEGAYAIDSLREGDKVLIAEACTHHPLEGDIGRQKLPKWLEDRAGRKLNITVRAGADFEEDLSKYKLIVHCGACMFNRKQMMSRILKAKEQSVPITNYGVAIAYMNGILNRVVKVFNI
ncbi:[FeFe] hydrogenase H-cluster maturation GTPase HydF [Caloramator quimbayensis]|uniref:[FeFe] hydrogenase H-cluster maturation GTPase HydF n=1 Tax=Caloramator quimbayensis TaxID=1147123 RepID=A0A1T4WEC3_9CLOT|nr:[FeFe] hydrogenase H-cluster maturation GTPase HydF [Caloramator quimbayensis]SKA75644.1 [FeFe] hydrogenase H-cluster maturation GTPase HydF [Caloramator quimbayensis]